MPSSNSRQKTRRRFLKATGYSTVASIALAGCSGDSENTSTTTQSGGGETVGSPSKGIKGTTFTYWDVINVQSQTAKQTIASQTSDWESKNGTTVDVNNSGYTALGGPKWVQAFNNGNAPSVYTADAGYTGKLIEGGNVLPADQWMDRLDSSILDAMDWGILETARYNYRGFGGGDKLFELPVAFTSRNPFVVRTDLWEKAGLSVKNDFPPTDYKDLIQKAKTLQQNSSADNGFQIFGVKWDYNDIMSPWAMAEAGKGGLYLNEDWSDTNFDSDAWKKIARQYYGVAEKGLTSQDTPTMADETMVQALNSGRVGLTQPEILNHPEFMSRAEQKMKDGIIQYGQSWGASSGQQGVFGIWSAGIPTQKATGLGDREYKERLQAAIQYLNDTWYSKEWQRQFPWTIGMLPVRNDVWDSVKQNLPGESGHKMANTVFSMAENIQYSWNAHPQGIAINFEIPGRHIPAMLKGEVGPDKTMNNIASDVRELL